MEIKREDMAEGEQAQPSAQTEALEADAPWEAEAGSPDSAQDRLAEVTLTFGANVRAARKARRWNQTELAQQLARVGVHMHQTQVAKIENGARPTSVAEVWAVASVLGLDYGQLLAPVVARPDRLVEAQHALDRAERRHAALRAELDRQAAEVQAAAKAVERLTKGKR